MTMKVTAVSGYAQSGKDTTASYVQKHVLRAMRVSFADPLKNLASELFKLDRDALALQAYKQAPLSHLPIHEADAWAKTINPMLTAELKDGFWTPRALLILLGSVLRTVDKDFWVKKACADIDKAYTAGEADVFVITDLRYRSEADALRRSFAPCLTLARVSRWSTSPSNDPSERDLDDFPFDVYLDNSRSLEEYEQEVVSKLVMPMQAAWTPS